MQIRNNEKPKGWPRCCKLEVTSNCRHVYWTGRLFDSGEAAQTIKIKKSARAIISHVKKKAHTDKTYLNSSVGVVIFPRSVCTLPYLRSAFGDILSGDSERNIFKKQFLNVKNNTINEILIIEYLYVYTRTYDKLQTNVMLKI